MAIEDNKDYALKGSQIKDLSDKVKAKAEQADTYTKAEVDGLIPDVSDFATSQELTDGLALKADKATTYTKTEVDGLIPDVSVLATKTELSEGLADKADANTTYTKTEVDTALAAKADTSTTYTKTEVDTALSAKADTATTYTKTEVDDLLDASKEVLVAVYEQTSYADVTAAIDAHKAIVLDMPANNNQFCMTFSTYTNGGNAIMYAIFKMSSDRTALMTVTLTPQNQWSVSHTDLQDKLVSGTNIKTVNGNSLLGSGNLVIGEGVETAIIDVDNFTMTIREFTQLFFSDKLLYIKYGGKNHLVNGKYNWTLLPEEEYELSYLEGNTIITHQFEVTDDVYYRGTNRKSAGVDFAVGKEKWYGTYTDENNVTYQTYTKTIFIPSLPSAAGITTYPIGVPNMKQIIDIFGTTTDGFKLNAPRQTVSDNITIYQVSKGSQTFSIEVGKDRSNKSAYVTIIYAKNN